MSRRAIWGAVLALILAAGPSSLAAAPAFADPVAVDPSDVVATDDPVVTVDPAPSEDPAPTEDPTPTETTDPAPDPTETADPAPEDPPAEPAPDETPSEPDPDPAPGSGSGSGSGSDTGSIAPPAPAVTTTPAPTPTATPTPTPTPSRSSTPSPAIVPLFYPPTSGGMQDTTPLIIAGAGALAALALAIAVALIRRASLGRDRFRTMSSLRAAQSRQRVEHRPRGPVTDSAYDLSGVMDSTTALTDAVPETDRFALALPARSATDTRSSVAPDVSLVRFFAARADEPTTERPLRLEWSSETARPAVQPSPTLDAGLPDRGASERRRGGAVELGALGPVFRHA